MTSVQRGTGRVRIRKRLAELLERHALIAKSTLDFGLGKKQNQTAHLLPVTVSL
jgi:hypothetical protein